MAEDWSVCITVYGAEPGLAPHRYVETFDVYTFLAEYLSFFKTNDIMQDVVFLCVQAALC